VSGLKLNEKSSCQAVEDLSNIREVSTLSSRNNDEIVTGGQGRVPFHRSSSIPKVRCSHFDHSPAI
jgi:hypothetical protein